MMIKKYYLTDEYSVSNSCGVYLWNEPFIPNKKPVLRATPPHEQALMLYGSVILEKNRYRMWYQILNRDTKGVPQDLKTCVGYAESEDGINWSKPNFDFHLFKGLPTNILVSNSQRSSLFSPSVELIHNRKRSPIIKDCDRFVMLFFDSMFEKDLEKYGSPFKIEPAVRGWVPIEGEGLFLAFSEDGFRWRRLAQPSISGPVDSCTISSISDQGFLASFKTSKERDKHFRIIGNRISYDLIHWTDEQVILKPDIYDPPGTEFYSLCPFEYNQNLFGLLTVYHNQPFDKSTSIQLVRALEKKNPQGLWIRCLNRRPILAPIKDHTWMSARVYASAKPIFIDDKICIYFSGSNTTHDDRRYFESSIGVAYLNDDQFGGLRASGFGGWFESYELVLKKHLNISVSSDIELLRISLVTNNKNLDLCSIKESLGKLCFEIPDEFVGNTAKFRFSYKVGTIFAFWLS